MTKIRVLLADDHTLIRGGIRALLESAGMEVVAESGDGREALELIAEHTPDVALLDIGMPGLNGLEVARQAGRQTGDAVENGKKENESCGGHPRKFWTGLKNT
jgi:DNA-binding NarL/FixJ family response regulator